VRTRVRLFQKEEEPRINKSENENESENESEKRRLPCRYLKEEEIKLGVPGV